MGLKRGKFYQPYQIILIIFAVFMIFALCLDGPANIIQGLYKINTSRSVLITDYIEVGGIGAALMNVVLVGTWNIFLLIRIRVKPNGSTIMALWLTIGFAFFGKNIFNMIPLNLGVWLYAKYQKKPFRDFTLVALLSATISPVVSEIAFLGGDDIRSGIGIALGILLGIVIGFVFPAIASFTVRVHDGYNLYNMGFAGGLLSSFVLALLQSFGIEVESVMLWSTDNNVILAVLLYGISGFLIVCGFYLGNKERRWKDLIEMNKHSGRLATDFYAMYGQNTYINMGILGALATTIVLALGADLNGPTISGILTIAGFGCFGKHLRNVIPVLVGAIISTLANLWDVTWPSNILAILFSTGLAPIAGQYGWIWGVVAGFLHVNFVIHIRFLNSGMNLYNNGYAAGFVALLLVPVITAMKKERRVKK